MAIFLPRRCSQAAALLLLSSGVVFAAPIHFESPYDFSSTVPVGPGTGAGTNAGAGLNARPAEDGPDTPEKKTFWRRDTLTGDWGSSRDGLKDRGFSLSAVYQIEYFGNTGGYDQGHIVDGMINIALELDLEKLTSGFWKDASIHTNGLYVHGPNLSARYVGDFSTTSNLAAYNTPRLQELWFQQTLFEKRFSLKMGLIAADTEFFGSPAAGLFINSTFGAPNLFGANFYSVPAYPIADPGIRLEFAPNAKWDFKAAVFSDNADLDPARNDRNGTYFDLKANRDGGLFMMEASYLRNQEPESNGLIGNYRLGGFFQNGDYHTFSSESRFALGTGRLSGAGTNYAMYGVLDQEFYKHDGKVSSFFARGGFADPRRSFVSGYFDLGFNFTGWVPGRPNDVAGFAFADSRVSRGFSRLHEAEGERGYSHEAVLEATYREVISPWWTLQPDLQYVFIPSGQHGSRGAFVFGVRTTLTF